MHPTDESLVAAYLTSDDQQAFRTLVERHEDRLYGYLMGMVRDRNVANDLFQETYLRVISALQNRRGSYAQQGRWLSWVMRIARNAALDHLRSRKKWVDVTGADEDETTFWDRLPEESVGQDEELHLDERTEWLEECIRRLPHEQREVLLMRQDAELTFKEIAAITDCSINTALGRMRYALLNLRKMMAESSKADLADLSSDWGSTEN
jgi:RNA polymerase sigma-70 factor (ECF subfamily)